MGFKIGTLVVSCTGSDKERILAVIGVSDSHLILADGRKRRLEKPKQKKVKHIRLLNKSLSCETVELLQKGKLTNKLLYRSIKQSLDEVEP